MKFKVFNLKEVNVMVSVSKQGKECINLNDPCCEGSVWGLALRHPACR